TTDTGNSTKTDNTATTAATGDNTKTDNTVTTTDTGNSTKTDNTATTAAAGDNTKTDNTATTTAVGDSAKTDNIMASSAANNNLPNSTTVQVSYQNLLTQLSSSSELNADSEALTNVTKDNFEDYFSLNGSATYVQTTGIVTITPDENDKVGSFFLKSKIDMNTSFTLTGQVNLGNKTSSQEGADGVGFAFHTGNTTDIGNSGGNLGIGGLQNAIGFKLDTFHNDYGTPWANEDGAQVAPTDPDGYGYDADPDRTKFPQFGAFVKTSQKLVQAQDGHYYSRWWGTTDMSSVQELNSRDLDGQFHDYVVSYDGSNRKLTIKYTETGGDVLTWSTSISDAYKAMAMVVSASTGYYKNLQQFKFSSFDFKQAATVNVKYVDQKGNQLAQGTVSYPSGADVNGTYTTGQLEIPNYKFVRMDDGTATGAKSLPATGTLTKAGDNGTVIYVYAPAYTQTSKTISETIKYTDQDGKEVAIGYTADPITFVTVTNPVDNTTTTYYSTKAKTATLDDNGVPTEAGWTKADSTDFAEVVNPEVDGYKVISNDAPNSDLTSVAVQTVYTNSSDLDFTVVYAPAYSTSKVKTVTETVHYIGQDGKPVANDASGIPTSFVTITNPIDGSTATYYSKTESGQPTLNNNGVPVGDWTQGNSTDFAAIINPSVIGQHVVSTTDPGNDLTQTTVKSIDSNSDNLDFTVTYEPNQEAANVTYIDDTTGKTLSAKDLTGDYGSTDPYRTGDTIADYEKQGYQLVSDNYPTNGVVYNQDGTVQSFEVHLTHGTTQTSESQTVNETIHYVYKNGDKAADDYQATPLNFTRTVTTDKVTGKKTYGSWSADQSFAAVTSPAIKGYTPDQAQIDTITGITADSADIEKTVTYVANKEAAKVTYIDDTTGKTLSSQDLSGDYGTTDSYRTADSIKGYEDQGYQLVSDNYPTNGVVYNQDGTVQSFEVHLTHGTTQTSESQTVNETIHYVYKNGDKAADDYQATPLNFTRTVTTDKVTGKKTYGSWSSDQSFAAVTSPELKGYTADKAQINKQTVNGDSKDLEFTVTYTKNAPTMTTEKKTVNETVSYVDQNGNELAQPHTASVDFTRQVSTDAVTGEKTYGPWSADQSFAAVTSPELKGYTADKAQIDKQTVNGDSKDLEFKVTYTKTPVAGGNVTAKYVDENGNPIADDVIASGNVGDPYSTTQKDVPGYTFKEVQGNPTGSFTDQDQTVTYVYTKNPATDNNGGTGLNQPGNPSQPSNATNNGVINTSTNTGSKVNNGAVNSPELPQTGENNSQSQTMSFIGILLAMFGSLLGFLGIKKRRND
ncbi:MAG: MucBP domain-containing protein, partial [Liquorilactobacillus hordei]|uniref:mucin-binding protein n=1 Tax=Liquorilactobacillus hordei TaxID=468911 RepID=UPI0039EC11BB